VAAPERRFSLFALAALVLAGCATDRPLQPVAPGGNVLPLCLALFDRADQAIERADVVDAGARRLADFPWLRLTRPLASFRHELDTPDQRDTWLDRLATADARGRRPELANLPDTVRARLAADWRAAAAGTPLQPGLVTGLADCRSRLNRGLARDPERMEQLVKSAEPFDEYRTAHRVLGLYPITRRVVLPRIANHQATRRAAIERPAGSGARQRRYAVPAPPDVPSIVPADFERDALGIPRPTDTERAALFSTHAPVWSVETDGNADRPGALVIGSSRPVADPNRPAEYRHWSWTRFRGRVLVQLSYLIWFPERPADGSVDIYAGHLDGLIWRVTLQPDGTPLAYESIHPCGCYYTVLPARDWTVRPPPGSEPVLAPVTAPRPRPDERVLVRLESGTHYLSGVEAVPRETGAPRSLAPLPLETLRSLPRPGGGRTSAFAEDGLIPSSRRSERFLLWPLGVNSPGTMRQWGTHAIAFVGKRHFDDPWLLEELLKAE